MKKHQLYSSAVMHARYTDALDKLFEQLSPADSDTILRALPALTRLVDGTGRDDSG